MDWIGTHWIALHVSNFRIIYFVSFGDGHVPKEIEKFIEHRNIKIKVFRIQANDSIMCGLFSPFDFEKNDNVTLSYFKIDWIQFHWNN